MKKLLVAALLFCGCAATRAQTFSATGDTIPDDGSYIYFDLNVSGLLPSVIDTTFGLEGICLDIIHTYDSDLDIFLIAPDSTVIEISTGNGGGGHNYTGTCFTDTVSNLVSSGSAPFSGVYKADGLLSAANNGQNGNGIWRLLIHDTYPFADWGILLNWSLTFGNHPCKPFYFPSSNLPIVVINTLGQTIIDEPKIIAHMGIIDNGPGIRNFMTDTFNNFNGNIGIEIRGSSSQGFPKKSFGFATLDTLGNQLDTTILNMPSEHDWILNANYTDKSFMRNVLCYQMSSWMGHYGVRYRYCELVINGQYQGIYILSEKIKRDQNRIDIAKLTPSDTTGNNLTGGYIVKIDKTTGNGNGGWTSNYLANSGGPNPYYQFDYPGDSIQPVQQDYIHSLIDSFENVMSSTNFANTTTGYPHFIDDNSFIDFFLINELAKNVDGYRISSYLYKDKNSNDSKLYAGPMWDFDIAWGNADYYGGNVASGWQYTFPYASDPSQVPFWWSKLLQDPVYSSKLKCRWYALRTSILNYNYLFNYIDSVALLLNESQVRNFTMWPILGVYVWPNPSPLPTTYAGCVAQLKTWLSNRIIWLDQHLPGVCSTVGIADNEINSIVITVSPNPFSSQVHFTLKGAIDGEEKELQINDLYGRNIKRIKFSGNEVSFKCEQLASGVYVYKIYSKGIIVASGKLIGE